MALPDCGDGLPPQVVATVMIHNEVILSQQGTSGKYAKIAVAKKALEMLTGMGLPEFRAKYRCDCTPEELEEEYEAHQQDAEDEDEED
jgi:endoribonuclease Dicer